MEIISGKKLIQKAEEFKQQSLTNINPQNSIDSKNQMIIPQNNKNPKSPYIDIKSFDIQQKSAIITPIINRSPGKTKLIFTLFLFTNLFINYDTGVIPASLIQIEKELNIDYTQQAALGIK